MSKLLESQVWQSDLKAELKPLAAVVADMGNDDGHGIYPSVAYLAWLLGRSDRSIQTSLRELSALGILQRVSHQRGGRHNVPHYRFHAARLPQRPKWKNPEKSEEAAPFTEKGENNGMKRVKSTTRKGEEFAPDPLVDPLVEEEGRGYPFNHFAVVQYSDTLKPEPSLSVFQAETIAAAVEGSDLSRAVWTKVLELFKGNGYQRRHAGNAVDRYRKEMSLIAEGKRESPIPLTTARPLTLTEQFENGLIT